MSNGELLFLLGLRAIFPRTAAAPRSRCVGFLGDEGEEGARFAAVDFLLVALGARCTGPAVAAGGLRGEGRLDTAHVEEAFAAVALD